MSANCDALSVNNPFAYLMNSKLGVAEPLLVSRPGLKPTSLHVLRFPFPLIRTTPPTLVRSETLPSLLLPVIFSKKSALDCPRGKEPLHLEGTAIKAPGERDPAFAMSASEMHINISRSLMRLLESEQLLRTLTVAYEPCQISGLASSEDLPASPSALACDQMAARALLRPLTACLNALPPCCHGFGTGSLTLLGVDSAATPSLNIQHSTLNSQHF